MRNRVSRGLIALTTVVALLAVYPTSTASADTITSGDKVCSMYVNSVGFGAFCSSGAAYFGDGPPPPTWKQRLGNNIFIPCRDFDVPRGIKLGPPPEGKTWVLRVTIEDYDLDTVNGGTGVHLERAIVPVSGDERQQCRRTDYMEPFWAEFGSTYPDPALQVKPTYTPRVNVPAYFSLTRESSMILKNTQGDPELDSAFYDLTHNLTMRGLVTMMKVDPGDGTPPFECRMGVGKLDDNFDGYDEKADPFSQMSTCSHKYKRSSANQPDGMYTVKLTITWTVAYWKGGPNWIPVGTADINAVQRLPVQELQSIGG
ncbi:hypothetical protein [Kribbella sp. CA-293567]|uniref:hypothetical protein n=1 Tax=Kribbella sp. CA-293567 TaxID=3002436 RepID=UPI0022DD1F0F|nr:hypothetical protein [Kribbella sp. CA-293567]WBQ01818.1 hypothetical protein OX958_17625 [Kribbella sp. CA-293567]